MYCKKCGTKVDDGVQFCRFCGTSLIDQSTSNTGQEIRPVEPPVSSPIAENERKSDNSNVSAGEPERISSDALEQQEWYYYEGSDKQGPFNYIQMTGFVKQGRIQRETMVWTDGMKDWMAADQSYLAKELGDVTPMAPLSTISEKWIWALAAGSTAIKYLLAFAMVAMKVPDGNAWIVSVGVVIANIVFLSKDIDEVKKSGRDVEAWLYLGVVLVPVYLFVRERNTNKNYAPLVVWCVLEGLEKYLLS